MQIPNNTLFNSCLQYSSSHPSGARRTGPVGASRLRAVTSANTSAGVRYSSTFRGRVLIRVSTTRTWVSVTLPSIKQAGDTSIGALTLERGESIGYFDLLVSARTTFNY